MVDLKLGKIQDTQRSYFAITNLPKRRLKRNKGDLKYKPLKYKLN